MDEDYESKLPEGTQRFVAHVIEHGFDHGQRAHEDFLRHFPSHAIMEALADHPQLRANIMVIATGVRTRIAIKQAPELCASILDIALAEQEADAETVVTLFHPDDRVRYLGVRDLWAYITEGEFWESAAGTDAHATAKAHTAFILERALLDRVITARDVVDGVGVAQIAAHVPQTELAMIIQAALDSGRVGAAFRDEQLLEQVSCQRLLEHLPLSMLWEGIVAGPIARALGVVPLAIAGPALAIPPQATENAEAVADVMAQPAPALAPQKAQLARVPLVKKSVRKSRRPPVKETTAAKRSSRRPKSPSKAPGKPRRSKRPKPPDKVAVPGPTKSK